MPTSDSADPSSEDELDLVEDSEGWDDVDADTEDISVVCLACPNVYPATAAVLAHCKADHALDILAAKQQHSLCKGEYGETTLTRLPDLDDYALIKLINYIRSSVKAGTKVGDLSDPSTWSDDRYLRPVLENDALLFSIGDIDTEQTPEQNGKSVEGRTDPESATVAELKAQLARLQLQFDAYREQVSQTLDNRWHENEATSTQAAMNANEEYDERYFEGYSYNDIHQTMLQDTVRTDAYRDFVYDNKHLFKDKVVMDVGCGTGILSMFCAKAGARKVIAVDNSAIINKAREIAGDNNLLDKIIFVKSKVEDIQQLPEGLPHVDIIISEWMGYCLFFEAMLPSVLVARDRFLKRAADGKTFDGLIVPSHCSLQIAPLCDPEWMTDNVSFWSDVYGFNMKCMMEKAFEDVVVQFPPAEAICGRSSTGEDLQVWDLYTTTVEDLSFTTPFSVTITKDVAEMDSWCIWFDIGFSPLPPAAQRSSFKAISEFRKLPGAVIFTTSPADKRTHWQSGVCVIEPDATCRQQPLHTGDVIKGQLQYAKGQESRALEIDISWRSSNQADEHKRRWNMR